MARGAPLLERAWSRTWKKTKKNTSKRCVSVVLKNLAVHSLHPPSPYRGLHAVAEVADRSSSSSSPEWFVGFGVGIQMSFGQTIISNEQIII